MTYTLMVLFVWVVPVFTVIIVDAIYKRLNNKGTQHDKI